LADVACCEFVLKPVEEGYCENSPLNLGCLSRIKNRGVRSWISYCGSWQSYLLSPEFLEL
jgi:hypothetical protein